MNKFFALLLICFFASCKTTTYYISRHAEKSSTINPNDPPLTDEGKRRAEALRDYLKDKKITAIYSTNYVRTKSTAEPTTQFYGIDIKTYNPAKNQELIAELKSLQTNALIIGHSNTVDDIVNDLTGQQLIADLPETEYGNLFIVKRKGNKFSFERIKL